MVNLRVPNLLVLFIQGLHPEIKRKIKGSLRTLLAEPHVGKPLREELEGFRSFRVNRIRIVYQIDTNGEIQVIAIGPRERIYEATYRLIRKERRDFSS